MAKKFLEIILKDFNFSSEDQALMEETLSNCELLIDNDGAIALQDFGQEIFNVYYISVAESERKKGKGMKKFQKILENKSPHALAAITCHPAILKIFDNLNRNTGYRYTKNAGIIDRVLAKMKEDEGEVGYLEEFGEYIVWKKFYGENIPQKNANFTLPNPLQKGDALLLILENTCQA